VKQDADIAAEAKREFEEPGTTDIDRIIDKVVSEDLKFGTRALCP
jgi:hypothetical protein